MPAREGAGHRGWEKIRRSRIAGALLGMAARPMRMVPDPELQRPVDIPVLVGDKRALRVATGWEPMIPLARTLGDVMADWRVRLAG
jgi:GDP-4-dehydro-6-deoxy-D-mannose reductase